MDYQDIQKYVGSDNLGHLGFGSGYGYQGMRPGGMAGPYNPFLPNPSAGENLNNLSTAEGRRKKKGGYKYKSRRAKKSKKKGPSALMFELTRKTRKTKRKTKR